MQFYFVSSTGVYTLASGVVSLHFEIIVDKHGGCPIALLTGDSETGQYSNV